MQDFRRGMFAPNVERRAEKPRASRGKGTDGPRMVSPRKILALGRAIWLTAPAGALQQDDPHARIRTTVELVVVPVTVKDSSGKLVQVEHQLATGILHRHRHYNQLDGGADARVGVVLLQRPGGRGEPDRPPQRQDLPWRNHAWAVSP